MDRDLQDFSKNVKNIGNIIGATFAVGVIQDFAMEAIKLGDQLAAAEKGFQRFGTAADLEVLKKSTKGMVSEVKLLQQAVNAGNFGIPVKELGVLFEFAQKRAKETGQEVDFLTNSIVVGLGRKSPQILDNLGITSTKLKEKLKGVSAESVTIAELTKVVGEIAKEELGKMGNSVETATDKVAQMATKWEDFKADFGQVIAPAVISTIDGITKAASGLGTFLSKAFEGIAVAASLPFGGTANAQSREEYMKQVGATKGPNLQKMYFEATGKRHGSIDPIKDTTKAIADQGVTAVKTVQDLTRYKEAVKDLLEFNESAPDYFEELNAELFKGSDYWFTYGERMAEALDTSALEGFMTFHQDMEDEVIPGIVNLSAQYERLNGVIGAVAGTIGNVLNESFTAALTNGEDFFKVFLDGLKKMALQLAATAGAALALSIILKSMGIGAGANIGQLFRVVGGQMGLPGLSGSSFNPLTGNVEGGLFGGRTTLRGNDIFLANSRSGYDLGRIGG
jgi:hypothetical protein